MSPLWVIGTALLLAGPAGGERRPVPLYTNDDLARVSPRRGETGVDSVPFVAPAEPPRGRAATPGETKTEAYWRARARRLEERLEPVRERLQEARERLEEKRRAARRQPLGARARPADAGGETLLRRQIERLEQRIRDAEGRLADEARRAGALPGWLR
jgi:hypothetical protein